MGLEFAKLLSERCYKICKLSVEDKKQIRLLILDFFSAAYAGYKQNVEFNKAVRDVVFSQAGTEEASVLFSERKYPARLAAFMNSLYGHGAELDDGNKKAMGHVGVHIIPAVLALAEVENKSEEEIMLAIAAGYEAYIRISAAAQPGMIERSFHSTGMAGAPACAVACAKLLDLNIAGIESAMSLACTMSSGLLTYSESQQMIKPINPAKAAESGVFAARLAQTGIIGPYNCLEGPNGWFHATTSKIHENLFVRDNSNRLLIHECYFKLYPSCRHTHCGIEAAINLHGQIKTSDIQNVKVFTYPNAIKLAGIKYPKDTDETKFSIPYTLACGLLYGEYNVNYMNPPKLTDEILSIIEKIELIPDDSMEDIENGIRGTHLKIMTMDGSVKEDTVLVPKGDPEKPLTMEDIIEKFRNCARGLVCKEKQDEIIDYLTNFGDEKRYCFDKIFKIQEDKENEAG